MRDDTNERSFIFERKTYVRRNRQARGEQTQKDILQSALELFLNHGYHGTSMRRIAQQAGIALGGIYNHFSSKEDLFVKILLKPPLPAGDPGHATGAG